MKRKKITDTMVRSANELREYLEELSKRIDVVEEQVDHRYSPHDSEKLNLTGTVGECTCDDVWYRPGCLYHGKPAPDPLHMRVAKANGQACWTDRDGKWRSHMGRFIPEGVEYPIVPDYPNDLVAAMKALEEYCDNDDLRFEIGHSRDLGWRINIAQYWSELKEQLGKDLAEGSNLPQAICEAIVAHAEGKC